MDQMRFFHEYRESAKIHYAAMELPLANAFYTLLMAAMRAADSDNLEKLKAEFPDVWKELQLRYNAPGGALTQEEFERLPQ